ncbi:MAG: restriction endonuclease subunit S [Methylococcales bacterium]|nr:restriction endonuclease subunit S [Methylococcales bacterium]
MSKWQFACDFMSVIRVYKLPVVLKNDDEPIIVSPAYTVFEVNNPNELHPEYLMMWFRRAEFDRYAVFKCDSAIRGGFDWEELCDTTIPVPSIEKQREIVKEYNVIVDRINLNNRLIQKLEETAQAIYKRWFVDFEFPDENGNPYKSNGGEMEFNKEFDNEIPKGWSYDPIGNYVSLSQGLVINATTNHLIKDKGIPLLRITDLINDTQTIFIDESVSEKNIAKEEDIIITRTGQVGLVFRNKKGVIYNNCFKITPNKLLLNKDYLFWFLKKESTCYSMIELASGSAQLDLTHKSFSTLPLIVPETNTQNYFSKISVPIENHKELTFSQNRKLIDLKNILLSKIATIN